MEASIATPGASGIVVTKGFGTRSRGSGFWGENTRGSLNVRFHSTQPCKSVKARSSNSGIAYAVYTPDINTESPVIATCKHFLMWLDVFLPPYMNT